MGSFFSFLFGSGGSNPQRARSDSRDNINYYSQGESNRSSVASGYNSNNTQITGYSRKRHRDNGRISRRRRRRSP
jgi:hypothetical protein